MTVLEKKPNFIDIVSNYYSNSNKGSIALVPLIVINEFIGFSSLTNQELPRKYLRFELRPQLNGCWVIRGVIEISRSQKLIYDDYLCILDRYIQGVKPNQIWLDLTGSLARQWDVPARIVSHTDTYVNNIPTDKYSRCDLNDLAIFKGKYNA